MVGLSESPKQASISAVTLLGVIAQRVPATLAKPLSAQSKNTKAPPLHGEALGD